MRPGLTVRPPRSSTRASAGAVTSAPTAAISPFRMTIVPCSITPRVTVWMRALVSAQGPSWARATRPDSAGRTTSAAAMRAAPLKLRRDMTGSPP